MVGNKQKKISKKLKCYSFFGPIEGHIVGTCKLLYYGILLLNYCQ